MAEEAAWLRALLAAEVDTAVGPEGLRSPGALAGVLGALLSAGTLVRGPDQALRLACDSDGARCAPHPGFFRVPGPSSTPAAWSL